MAKHLCMIERNEKGMQARAYFIEMEKQARQPVLNLNDPAVLRQMLLGLSVSPWAWPTWPSGCQVSVPDQVHPSQVHLKRPSGLHRGVDVAHSILRPGLRDKPSQRHGGPDGFSPPAGCEIRSHRSPCCDNPGCPTASRLRSKGTSSWPLRRPPNPHPVGERPVGLDQIRACLTGGRCRHNKPVVHGQSQHSNGPQGSHRARQGRRFDGHQAVRQELRWRPDML